ncbi:MAG: LysR family transcriptional regulator [Candidatus Woesearchaeota archaeon]
MLDVRRLRILREVARCGSFSSAAESLGYTQPAISRHVALLEQETGATLLERLPTGIRLTDAGELLVRHTATILSRLQDAEDELGELLGLRAGELRMSTLTSAAATLVPWAVVEFRKRLPDVELSVSMVDPNGVLPLLRNGEVDLALCNDASHLELPDMDGIVLFEEPMLIALPREHRLAGRKTVNLSDLAEERWMLGTTQSCPDAGRFIRTCHAAGFDPDIAFHNDDYTAILGFVGAGIGVAPVPDMVARSAPSDVCVCGVRGTKVTRPICAVMPGGYQPGPARAMLEVLQEASRRWCDGGRQAEFAVAGSRAA